LCFKALMTQTSIKTGRLFTAVINKLVTIKRDIVEWCFLFIHYSSDKKCLFTEDAIAERVLRDLYLECFNEKAMLVLI